MGLRHLRFVVLGGLILHSQTGHPSLPISAGDATSKSGPHSQTGQEEEDEKKRKKAKRRSVGRRIFSV